MRPDKSGPAVAANDGAGGNHLPPHHSNECSHFIDRQRQADEDVAAEQCPARLRCRLHGTPIVNSLPADCPMRSARVFQILLRTQDEAYRLMDRGMRNATYETRDGLKLLDHYKTCNRCVQTLAEHPVVKALRADYKREEARAGQPKPLQTAARVAHRAHGTDGKGVSPASTDGITITSKAKKRRVAPCQTANS